MEEVGQGLVLIGIYIVVVGGGYLYEFIKKRRAKNKKVKNVIDQVNYELEEEERLESLKKKDQIQAEVETETSTPTTKEENSTPSLTSNETTEVSTENSSTINAEEVKQDTKTEE